MAPGWEDYRPMKRSVGRIMNVLSCKYKICYPRWWVSAAEGPRNMKLAAAGHGLHLL